MLAGLGETSGERPVRNAAKSLSILIIDGDEASARQIAEFTRSKGWVSQCAATPSAALTRMRQERINLLLVDLFLGGEEASGLDFVASLPDHEINLPVLMTGRNATASDRAAGLMAGADCFLAKPVDEAELQAQILAIARRLGFLGAIGAIGAFLQVGPLELRPASKAASWSGNVLSLTDQQFRLLQFLAEEAPAAVNREALWERVWPRFRGIEPQAPVIEQAIRRLRMEFARAAQINPIVAERSAGYRLTT